MATAAADIAYTLLRRQEDGQSRVDSHKGIIEGGNPAKYNPSDPITLFIIQAAIIIIFCRMLEWPLSKIRQPRVIAEVIGGILLGPSVMGRIPGFTDSIFPTESLPALNLVANIGLLLFLFLIGVEIDLKFMASQWKPTLSVAIGSLVLPFGLGCALAWGVHVHFGDDPELAPIDFPVFMLFIGIAIAITAFPVLCRIMTELQLLTTSVGNIVLAAGVANDVIGWVLLALCVTLVNAGQGLSALWVLLVALGWAIFLFLVVKPLFVRYLHYTGSFHNGPSQKVIIVTLLLTFTSAFFTNVLGVHAIFGAFLVGLICPHESGFAIKLTEKIEDLVATMFLPLYFTLSGLKTDIGLLDDGKVWGFVITIVVVAFASKVLGSAAGAKLCGLQWRESFSVGVLMSCKGLVELIVLNIGLQAKILSTRTFTMFVLMALITTFLTTPLTMWLYPPWYQQKLEKWRRGEISWDTGDPTSLGELQITASERLSGSKFRNIVVYLRSDSLLPTVATISLFGTSNSAKVEIHPSLRKNEDAAKHGDNHMVPHVHGVAIHELGQRDSSVMKVSDPKLEDQDPLVASFKAGALMLSNAGVTGQVSLMSSSYVDTLVARVDEAEGDLLFVPWSYLGPMNESRSLMLEFEKETYKSIQTRMTNPESIAFATGIFSDASCPVAMLIYRNSISPRAKSASPTKRPTGPDRSLSVMSIRSQRDVLSTSVFGRSNITHFHVVVPYFGGADDRLALWIGLQLANNNETVTLSVIHFIADRPASSSSSGAKASRSESGTVHGSPELGPTLSAGIDDRAYLGSLQHALSPEQASRIIFTESSAGGYSAAVATDVHAALDISAGESLPALPRECLVVCGRASVAASAPLGGGVGPSSDKPVTPTATTPMAADELPASFRTTLAPCIGSAATEMLIADVRASLLVVQMPAGVRLDGGSFHPNLPDGTMKV